MNYCKDTKIIEKGMKEMFPKPLEEMHYDEIIDAIKKDKKYGFKHIALKIMVDGLEEHNREHQKYVELQKKYVELRGKIKTVKSSREIISTATALNDYEKSLYEQLQEVAKQKTIISTKLINSADWSSEEWKFLKKKFEKKEKKHSMLNIIKLKNFMKNNK